MVRPARRRFGTLVTTLLLLPCLSGCAIPFPQQFATGTGGGASSPTVTAPTATTSADDKTSGEDAIGTADSSTGASNGSKKKSSAGGEEGDDLIEDPKYYSACTFQHRSKDGLPEGEKKPVSEAGSDDYPVMEYLGLARTVQGDSFVYIKFKPPITNSQKTTFTIYPNQERKEFLQIQVARDMVQNASFGRGNPNDISNREPSNKDAFFAKDRINDPKYSSNNVILTRIEKKHSRSYRLESVLTMETDKTVSECAYNPDDPNNKAS